MQPDRIIRSRRKTVAIEITPEGKVWVRAPLRTPRAFIDLLMREKAGWIEQHLVKVSQIAAARRQFTYAEGELHFFLGQQLPLRFAPASPGEQAICLPASARRAPQEALESWYKAQAARLLPGMVQRLAGQYGLQPKKVRISSARTRWGSCSSKGTISLAWKLVLAPPEVIDYVITHELAHLQVLDHSARFWELVESFVPDHKARRAWLRLHKSALGV